MTQSIDAAPPRRAQTDTERRNSDADLFADDPFDQPLAPPDEDGGDDWGLSADRNGDAPARPKRRVIVDDAYGWSDPAEAQAADPDTAAADRDLLAETKRFDEQRRAAEERRGRVSSQLPAPLIDPLEPTEPVGAGGVWWWAMLASLIWVGGVLAFSVGFFQLPIQPVEALIAEALTLDVKLQIMVLAAALGPLGLIWMHALNARRARMLAAEAKRLTRLASKISASAAAPSAPAATPSMPDLDIDPHALRIEVEGAARALDALDEKFAAAEDRAQASRERLETEREHLAKLVREIEAEATRAEQEADRFRQASSLLADAPRRPADGGGADGYDAGRAEELAGMIAKALAAQNVGATSASAASIGEALASREPARASRPEPETRGGRREAAEPVGFGEPEFDEDGFEDDEFGDDPFGAPARGEERREARRAPEPAREAKPRREEVSAKPAAKPASTLDWEKFVRAANFPDSEDDRDTLEALYAVLTDREAAALLQTAEDVLSTLADLNLFMEDMHVHHAPIELWKAYIVDGETRDVLDIGGVRDPHAIEDVEFALNERPEFVEISKTFFEQYENMAARLFAETEDPTLAVELADTRTGRAFMLIGRADGRFGD